MTKNRPFLFVTVIILIGLIYYVVNNFSLEDQPMPTQLHPLVLEKSDQLIEQAEQKGITIRITDEFRSIAEQNNLYEQGRSDPGSVVTNVQGGESYHNYGLAIDFAIELEDGSVIWDLSYDGNQNGESDWMEVVDIAKELGFTWGGDWENFRDYPHLQMDFGLSIWELKRGKRPEGMDETE
ncbi:M15 family metallopeptidase [Aquibacillus koreensis]|uniref:M15 family metallopeptidase n=1 Tax=Aquibacillus koreensis TaxID=279446 RepID=A0A9X3WLQ8_9BACI|nr:M15 family metallopeptidase [Aquibacillus koreensis]MCT2536147.1 M15 family metallopeptidase [Aquibacillus koreensis]MDC3422072.1 M15 family metallopeptidase [Aquibacillus koreensis]